MFIFVCGSWRSWMCYSTQTGHLLILICEPPTLSFRSSWVRHRYGAGQWQLYSYVLGKELIEVRWLCNFRSTPQDLGTTMLWFFESVSVRFRFLHLCSVNKLSGVNLWVCFLLSYLFCCRFVFTLIWPAGYVMEERRADLSCAWLCCV